jgi:hypothetical protein
MARVKGSTYAVRIERTCEWCGTIFLVTQGQLNKTECRFCSQRCVALWRSNRDARPIEDRFWAKVQRTNDPGSCWQWTAAKTPKGYGHLGDRGKTIAAHVLAWEIASGEPVPDGLLVLHTCDVPGCVRNDDPGIYIVNGVELPRFGHLFLGTHEHNMRDCAAKDRLNTALKVRPELAARGERNGMHTHPERASHGTDRHNAKLNEEGVREIRRLYALGNTSQAAIAQQFGVTQTVIGDIVRRVSWKHVHDESPECT